MSPRCHPYVPVWFARHVSDSPRPLSELLAEYPRRYCPICGNVVSRTFLPGPGGRPDAACPKCRSLERHRFFALVLDMLAFALDDVAVLLEIAPSPETTSLLADLGPRTHVRLDLGADNRLVDVLGSLTELPLPDRSVDLLVCYHVLEHIPNDRRAMTEIARVLSPTGVGLIQVPFRKGTVTDEDPEAGEDERVRRFGRADHVRYYGDDFEDRLVDAGLSMERFTPRSVVGEHMSTWLHLNPDELVWVVHVADGAMVPPPLQPAPTSLSRTYDAMLGEMLRMREGFVEHRRLARRLQADLDSARAQNGPGGVAGRLRSLVRGRDR
jgi:SAM-dependent methyltransferase